MIAHQHLTPTKMRHPLTSRQRDIKRRNIYACAPPPPPSPFFMFGCFPVVLSWAGGQKASRLFHCGGLFLGPPSSSPLPSLTPSPPLPLSVFCLASPSSLSCSQREEGGVANRRASSPTPPPPPRFSLRASRCGQPAATHLPFGPLRPPKLWHLSHAQTFVSANRSPFFSRKHPTP